MSAPQIVRRYRKSLGAAAVAALYFLAAVLSSLFTSEAGLTATLWPASGVAMVGLLVLRRAGLIGVALGATAAALFSGATGAATFILAVGCVAEAVAACLIWHRLRLHSRMLRMRDALGLAFGCALVAPLPASLAAALAALTGVGETTLAEMLAIASHTWMAHSLGILATVPALLAVRGKPPGVRATRRRLAASLLLLHAGLTTLAFQGHFMDWIGEATIAYLVLPVMVWIALSCGTRSVAASIFVLVAAGTWSFARGTGALTLDLTSDFRAHLLMFTALAVASVTTLLVSAVAMERRATAGKLRGSLDRFVALASLSADWYWEQDETGALTVASGRAIEEGRIDVQRLLGPTGTHLAERVSVADRERFEAALAARRPFRDVALPSVDARGAPIQLTLSGEPMQAEDGKFIGYRGVAHDVTLQYMAEEKIAQSRRFLESLIEAIPNPVLVKDMQHRYIAVNHAFEAFFRRPRAEILGRTDHDFFEPEQAAFFLETDSRAISGDRTVQYEKPYTLNGHTTWMMTRKSGLTAPDGSRMVVLLLTDISARREAEEKLRESEQRFRSLTELSADWYWEQDANYRFTYVSPTALHGLLSASDDVIGKTRFEADFEWESDEIREEHRRTLAARQPFRDLVVRARRTGRWGLTSGEPVFGQDGAFLGYRGIGRDVTELKRVERQLRESESRFRDFAEAASEFVWECDALGRYTYLSPKVRDLLGYTHTELIGRQMRDLMPPGEAERAERWLADNTREDGSYREFEHRLATRSGNVVWVTVNAVSVRSESGEIIGHRGTVRDVTDRKQAEERISHLATRDPLTGLPNRLLLHDRLDQGLVNARRSRQSLALMFIDLDRFKNINDSLGHDVGDLLLKEVAERMQGCLRKGDTLSRLGGDEFVVTVEGLQHAEDAAQVARKILAALGRPMDIAGHTLTTSCSVGISIFPSDAEDAATLMKNADTAMYHAKEKGRRNYQFFSREMNIRAVERHDLETALRLALDRDEFVLHYQPQVDIVTGRLAGVEALLRWRHPRKGLVLPSTFIEVAEETGLIEPIGSWVLRTACEQCKAWQDAGYPEVRVAVNVSARQFNHPAEFARSVQRMLARTGLDPSNLELEMTESVIWRNADDSLQAFRRLGKLGTRLAVDDFGTGYSSLATLKQLPIDTLKIDRSFVRDVDENKESDVLVATIIGMAHSLDLSVTAEGVENLAQLSSLKRLGCDEYQGFLFSKPLPPEELARKYLAPYQLEFGG